MLSPTLPHPETKVKDIKAILCTYHASLEPNSLEYIHTAIACKWFMSKKKVQAASILGKKVLFF